MTVIITENVTTRLRGELTNWMLELKPGVFVGKLSALVREKLWEKVKGALKSGGAILIQTKNNEQKFEIKMEGNCSRELVDFDGLQLIKFPKALIPIQKKSREGLVSNTKQKNKLPSLQLNGNQDRDLPSSKKPILPHNYPLNFIERSLTVTQKGEGLDYCKWSRSSYEEYSESEVWDESWLVDVYSIVKELYSYLNSIKDISNKPFYNKKIVALDIETTDYIPKAKEGFVNVIGLAILDAISTPEKNIRLTTYQSFNMLRKKDDVPQLLHLSWPYMKGADILLVFNRSFDIDILDSIIQKYHLNYIFPAEIIDLMKDYPSLNELEADLFEKKGFRRTQTKKGKYSDYYKLFKGPGKKGDNKKLEPLAVYNMIDTLTPLFMYLLQN